MTEQNLFPPTAAVDEPHANGSASCHPASNGAASAENGSASRRPAGTAAAPTATMPSPQGERPAGPMAAGCVRAGVSDTEIAQLVYVALEGAMRALGERNPEQFLHARASEGRMAMHEVLASLPHTEATDVTVQTEYRKAIVFQDEACNLAREMMHAVTRYASARAVEPRLHHA